MNTHLIIQDSLGKTLYAGDGYIEQWREKLGSEPSESYYNIMGIKVDKASNDEPRYLGIRYRRLNKADGYERGNLSVVELELDNLAVNIFKKVLEEIL